MAEFPFYEPEQILAKNLWRSSKMSEHQGMTSAASITATPVEDGLELEATSEAPTGAYSLIYTQTSYRIPVESNKPYSWAIPIRNSGDKPFPVRINAWIEASGTPSGFAAKTLEPGETWVARMEGMDSSDTGVDIRFSLYYSAGSNKPEVGAKIVMLDGITLVQDRKSADPFNGDGQRDLVLRRNLIPNPNFATDDVYTIRGDISRQDGALKLTSTGGSTYVGQAFPLTGIGKYAAISAGVNWVDGGAGRARLNIQVASNGTVSTNVSSYLDKPQAIQGGRLSVAAQVPDGSDQVRDYLWAYKEGSLTNLDAGQAILTDKWIAAVADTEAEAMEAVATFFDGDTAPSGNLRYRWLEDGTSEEYRVAPEGSEARWLPDGTSELYIPAKNVDQLSGVTDLSIATEARLGLVADVYSRSRSKIALELASVDDNLVGGERVELAAAAMTASPAVWHWRQISGPEVALEPRENCVDFIAPDVNEPTELRVAVYAASEDGRNRSDWHYFDLTIEPSMMRFRAADEIDYVPATPRYVGYDRGKREIWNDVIPPNGFGGRREAEILDLGVPVEDVEFSEEPPEACVAGGIYVNPVTGDIFRNFGAGYNETDDTTAAPRRRTYWVNPATGDISKWIEDEYVG